MREPELTEDQRLIQETARSLAEEHLRPLAARADQLKTLDPLNERDAERILLRENESVYLPLGSVHRLENPGMIPLTLIEVQSGAYLGEDDIVRFEDTYGRT